MQLKIFFLQKFSFVHLERLLSSRSSPILLQTLVLTLFCPNQDRDCDEAEGPMTMGGCLDSTRPKLVDMFTPEFCLKIGDTFVKSFRAEKVPEKMDIWLQHQVSATSSNGNEPSTTLLADSEINELKKFVLSVDASQYFDE